MASAGLAVVLPVVVEIDNWFARRLRPPPAAPVSEVVAPARATVATS